MVLVGQYPEHCCPCHSAGRHLFVAAPLPGLSVGLILLAGFLAVICTCLLLLVRLLNSGLKDQVAETIRRVINNMFDMPLSGKSF